MEPDERERVADRSLDAALKQYGQAEPRPGLENRLRASLRAERERTSNRKRQWWPAVAAITAILTIAVGVFVARSDRKHTHPPIAKNIPAEVRGSDAKQANPQIQEATKRRDRSGAARHGLRHVPDFASARLEQFPSPEPLSQQEQMLARYVEQFPQEAGLMARAQTELTRQEVMEQQIPMGNDIPPNSEPQNQ